MNFTSRNALFQDAFSDLKTSLSPVKVTSAYHNDGLASFPQVVVRPFDSLSASERFYDSEFSGSNLTLIVEVHTFDAKTLDELSDSVVSAVKDIVWSETLYFVGVDDFYSFNAASFGSTAEKRNIHTRILSFSYARYG